MTNISSFDFDKWILFDQILGLWGGADQSLIRPMMSVIVVFLPAESNSMYFKIDSLHPEIVVTPRSSDGEMKYSYGWRLMM